MKIIESKISELLKKIEYVLEANKMELNGKKILFLVDSITEGCGTSGAEKTFCSIIAHKYKAWNEKRS